MLVKEKVGEGQNETVKTVFSGSEWSFARGQWRREETWWDI